MKPAPTNDQSQTTSAANGPVETAPRTPSPEERLRRQALGEQAWAAFQRDWPQLAEKHFGQWVAYHGDRQLGLAPTQTQLYQDCWRRGLSSEEFHVFCIEPDLPDHLFVDWPALD